MSKVNVPKNYWYHIKELYEKTRNLNSLLDLECRLVLYK